MMNTWEQRVYKVLSVLVIISTVATSLGVVAVRPVVAAEPDSGQAPAVYLPVRWQEQDADDPSNIV